VLTFTGLPHLLHGEPNVTISMRPKCSPIDGDVRLFLIATPLTFFPRVLNLVFGSLLTEMNKPDALNGTAETTIRTLNVLEKNLAHFAGLACFTLAILIVVQVRSTSLRPFASYPRIVPSHRPFRKLYTDIQSFSPALFPSPLPFPLRKESLNPLQQLRIVNPRSSSLLFSLRFWHGTHTI